MNQEIHFKGLSLTPDDHHTQPGELSVCTNVELHNGGLRPSVINGTNIANKLKMDNDIAKLLHVHTISNHTYLIGSVTTETTTNLYWFNEDGSHDNDNLIHSFGGVTVISVQSIGNTLSILTSDGLHYARLSNGKYLYIGSRMPELELAFALDVEDAHDEHRTTLDLYHNDGWGGIGRMGSSGYIPGSYTGIVHDFADDEIAADTEAILSVVNKFIDKYQQEGKFLFPFFVRYAYKLYDNRTITMHSAPILMPCGSGTPYAIVPEPYDESDYLSRLNADFYTFAPAYTLKYKLCNSNLIQELEKWSDIITGVEIYISQPLYRYDASGQVKTITCIGTRDGTYEAEVRYKPFHDAFTVCNGTGGYAKRMVTDLLTNHWYGYRKWLLALPLKDEDDYNKEIRECSEFFLLKTIDISKLATEMTDIEIKEGYLKTLTAQKQMTDDYDSHDTIMPQQIYMYNNRINAVDITKKLFSGYLISSQYAYKSEPNIQGIMYFIEQEGRQVVVSIDENQSHGANEKPYLFYPNPNAKFAIIASSSGFRKVPLKGHSFLTGAVYFNDIYTQEPGVEITREEFEQIMAGADSNNIFPTPNKVYTSEIDNPYYFPVEGIATVGVGRIIGLAGITRALSPGQMGVHKMMAFCTDGVWALTVGDVGLFGNADRISFDVCVSKESICQLGQSVLFATDKGISRVRESDVQSVSDALDGAEFDISELPGLTAAVNQYLGSGSIFIGPNTPQLKKSPLEFLKSARLVYDFPNSRVIAFSASPNDQIAMVLASDGTWSVMRTPAMTNHVVGYPYTYIELSDGQLKRLDMGYNYLDESRVKSLIVTRGLSWSSTMQVIQSFQQIHNSGHNTLLILYGSNDGRTWSYIGKSERSHASYLPGHPFRFFRVAILMQLKQSEIYSKLILDVKDKYEKL